MSDNERVDLEENRYIDLGPHPGNGRLVESALDIIERIGTCVPGPDEARQKFGLN